ncbi:MAG: hypothetical protein JNL98_21230 [Bryobacterales bacterium]|nr:hypothetical protein [Bryobacterales bacterium]
MPAQSIRTATIAAGQSLSGAVDLAGLPIVGLYMPAVWDTAEMTFQASYDGSNWHEVDNITRDPWRIEPDAGKFYPVVRLELEGIRFMRIRSGKASVPIAQSAERTIRLVLKE